MDEFRKKLKRRQRIYRIMCCVLPIGFLIIRFLTKETSDFSQGMMTGLFSGGIVAAAFFLARIEAMLHNEEKLRKQYIVETDERNNAIAKETMRTASMISMIVTAIAVIVTGFFNEAISIALCVMMFADLFIVLAVNAYFRKHM